MKLRTATLQAAPELVKPGQLVRLILEHFVFGRPGFERQFWTVQSAHWPRAGEKSPRFYRRTFKTFVSAATFYQKQVEAHGLTRLPVKEAA